MTGLRRVETRVLVTIVAVAGALAAFAALADEVAEGGTGRIDRLILLAFRVPGHPGIAIGPRWLQEAARDVTALGGFTVLTLVTVLAAAMLVIYGRRRQALVCAVTVALAQVASELLKTWMGRPRPALVAHFDSSIRAAFPAATR